MMSRLSRVLVLLSTYNGEKYFEKQLDSILSQTGVELSILIRDDGSSDMTICFIEKYMKNYSNIFLLRGKNCGSARSFMKLICEANTNYTDYEYYAFCDQDDVWLPEKLQAAIGHLEKADGNKQCLYLGSYQMVDKNLNSIPTSQIDPSLNLVSAFVSNPATGCTMVLNRKLLGEVATKRPEYMIMHDYWVYLTCLAIGGYVYYDKTPYILYRQHDHNVIGGKKDPFIKKWCIRVKKIFKKGDCFKSRMAVQLLNCYGDKMTIDDVSFLKQIVTCKRLSSKVKLLRNVRFKSNSIDKNLQLFGLIISGKL